MTARRTGYLTAVLGTPTTAAVLPGTNSVRTAPAITGQTIVGQTLTASSGTWAVPPSKVAYQWYADEVALPGATASTLTLARSTLDQRISVAVTATADGYAPKAASSSATGPVVRGTVGFTASPTITGARRVGHVLTAEPGSFSPTTATPTYQWLRRGQPIAGATGQTYVPTPADVGRRLSVKVTLSAPQWASAADRIGTVARIKAVPRVTARTASHATWARVVIRVVTPGLSEPDGTVRVFEGRTRRATVAITDGRGRVRLDRLSRGAHHLVLRYRGPGAQVAASLPVSVRIG